MHIAVCLFAVGAWLSTKRSYTEAESSDVHNLNQLLNAVKLRGCVTDDLRAQIDAVTGDFLLRVVLCYSCFVGHVIAEASVYISCTLYIHQVLHRDIKLSYCLSCIPSTSALSFE